MSNFQKILDSFQVKDTLNPKVWKNPKDPDDAVMKPIIRRALLRIAEEFIDYLGEDVFVEDIVLTGSLSNFNWSEFSDFDLHVIVDLQQYENQAELYKELYNLKKQVFNDSHNIRIYGYDVELYAQDVEEEHYSSGVFSIMNDEWINKPKKLKNEVDKKVLEIKIKHWIEKIDKVTDTESSEDDKKLLQDVKDKLKKFRQSGLEKDGELSYENLVFKFLRRSGHIEKLFDSLNKATDKELSVERKLEDSEVNEASSSSQLMGGKSIKIPKDGSHAGQNNWQSSNAWDIKGNIGDPIHAIAPGTVISYSNYGESVIKTSGKKLYGISFTIKGEQGFPDVYYTHLKNSNVSKGDKIECGQLVGYIMDFPGSSYDHVHIGVEPGNNIRDLIDDNGNIKCSKGIKFNFFDKNQNKHVKSLNSSDFLKDLKKIAEEEKTYKYDSNKEEIPYFTEVEPIQTSLQFLGFSLPKWGVDGKFGPETERATKDFQQKYKLPINGTMDKKTLQHLVASLVIEKFKDSDLSSIKKEKDLDS